MDLRQNRIPDYEEQRDWVRAIKHLNIEKLSAFINTYGVDATVLEGTGLHQAQYSFDVNQKDGQNNSPLSKAIFHYKADPDFIKLLLANKAYPYLNLIDGYTAIDLAKSKNLKDILEIIDQNPT